MLDGVYLGFDFGYKRIGVAVGQSLTCSASPLPTLDAKLGVPNWGVIQTLVEQWRPIEMIVGLPTCIDNSEQYTTAASKGFARQLRQRKIKQTAVDSIAACIILEQWLREHQ